MNILVIFNDVFRPMAFASVSGTGQIVMEIQPGQENLASNFKHFIDGFSTRSPRLKSETLGPEGMIVDLVPVTNKDQEFLRAIAEELDRAGFVAKIIPSGLKMTLIYLLLQSSLQQRQDLITELFNLSDDIKPEEMVELQNLVFDIEVLKIAGLDRKT